MKTQLTEHPVKLVTWGEVPQLAKCWLDSGLNRVYYTWGSATVMGGEMDGGEKVSEDELKYFQGALFREMEDEEEIWIEDLE